MALFDFSTNNIENINGSNGGWIKILFSAIGGFVLKTFYDEWIKKKDIKEVGETFELELKSFKEVIEKQARILNRRLAYIKTHEDKKVMILFTDNFELIKSLNKLSLVKFYKKTYDKDASSHVTKTFNSIAILKLEIDRLKQGVNDFNIEKNNLIKEYTDNLKVLIRHFAVYEDKHKKDLASLGKDPVFIAFNKLYTDKILNKTLNCKYIMTIQDEVSKRLFSEPFDNTESLHYQLIFEVNSKARDIIQTYQARTNDFKNLLTVVIDSLKSTYFELYGEKLIPSNPDTLVEEDEKYLDKIESTD